MAERPRHSVDRQEPGHGDREGNWGSELKERNISLKVIEMFIIKFLLKKTKRESREKM